MALNTLSANFSADVSTYIAKKTLSIALKEMSMYQVCDKATLPKMNGRVFQYTRYERVVLPQSTLSEGVTPGDTGMSISTVTATMDQWGAVIPLSDVSIDSVTHPVLQKAIELAAYQAKETVDREICLVMLAGTNIFYPNAIAARGSLTTSDKLDSGSIGKVVSSLRYSGARPYDGTFLVGLVDPYSEEDLISSSAFLNAAQYSNIKVLMNQEIGEWKGVRWIRSNTIPSVGLATGASAADSSTAGSLANSTAYYFKLAVVNPNTGHEEFMTAQFTATTGSSHSSLDITVPALPTGAIAGSTFRLYAGSVSGTLYLKSSGIAASASVNVGTIPTSGTLAQAAAPSGVRVHFAFILGKEAITCVELNTIKSYLTPAVASDSDPLVQRRKVGWKCDFKAVICNQAFMARLEHYTTNGTNP